MEPSKYTVPEGSSGGLAEWSIAVESQQVVQQASEYGLFPVNTQGV